MKHRKIGIPKTIGELKEMIKFYPDETELNFRNNPRPELVEFTHNETIIVYMQESIKL